MEGEGPQLCAILDAGSQFAKVIDRRVRELNVESLIIPFETPASELTKFRALIISGGPDSVYSESAPKYDPEIFNLGIPILGICYGMQLMVQMNAENGGKIARKDKREDGQFHIKVDNNSVLYKGLPDKLEVLLTHGDTVECAGKGYSVTGTSALGLIASIENTEKKFYGVQYHPEVDLTTRGKDILYNFLFGSCSFAGSYTMEDRKDIAIRYIKESIGDKRVLVLVSGGVDSSVCAALLRLAVPKDKLFAIHVDSGFMRKDESKGVMEALKIIGVDVHLVNAQERFANATTMIDEVQTEALNVTMNPEHKRKIIGNHFMAEAQKECDRLGLKSEDVILAQGTLRPDLIESASTVVNKGGTADCIKTHHNDTSLVRELRARGRVIEPLKDYHKDEVRRLGKQLGLPDHLVHRQPFPGPGLAIRMICSDTPYITKHIPEILNKLDDVQNSFETDTIKCSLLGFRTVGVQGDGRTYSHCVGLTSVGEPNWADLMKMAKTIPTAIHQINRVVYIWGPPLTGHQKEITETRLKPEAIHQLREADSIVNSVLYKYKLVTRLSQVPVILFPNSFGVAGGRSVCIRTFITNDFMTGVPAVPGVHLELEALQEMVSGVSKVKGVSRVAYDLTSKPPGTTEWE